jgi:7-carboxy-7-deazaguanine synthase
MYAVDPEIVRNTAEQLTSDEIVRRVANLGGSPEWVTISGGNPALHKLHDVVEGLHDAGFRVAVETQGSRWTSWLRRVDRLTISPKPPSSAMATPRNDAQFDAFMARTLATVRERAVLKVVVFDDRDLDWARGVAARWSDLPFYLSAGTPVPAGPDVRDTVGNRYAWLCESVAGDRDLARARVLPQLHVIAWKGATGV